MTITHEQFIDAMLGSLGTAEGRVSGNGRFISPHLQQTINRIIFQLINVI